MSFQLDEALKETGTRFRLYPLPKYVDPAIEPEIVAISVPVGQVQAGPADDRMFVVDAQNKLPYTDADGPPYKGPVNPPVSPAPDGHFDHLDPSSRAFYLATMYATVRRALDIWQDYFGHRIEWQFAARFARMELIPLIEWDNAQSGFGFLEFGYGRTPLGGIDHGRPFCVNYDVLTHEVGHSIIYSQVGEPKSSSDPAIDYGGFQESSADLVAIVSVLHFNTVVDRLLANTSGDLFTVNELDRVGELSADRQVRIAFNYSRMSDVGNEPHDRSLPLTGAVFDIFVEYYQKQLVAQRLISADLAKRSTQDILHQGELAALKKEFDAAYKGREAGFKAALLKARDYLGTLLAKAWSGLNPDFMSYYDVTRALLAADQAVDAGQNQDTIRSCFAWREIVPPARSSMLRTRALDDCGVPAHAPAATPEGGTDMRVKRRMR